MKKVLSFLALVMCAFALNATPTITVSDYTFETQSIKGLTYVEEDATLLVAWDDLPLYSSVAMELKNMPPENCAFAIDGGYTEAYIYTGSGESYDPFVTSYDLPVYFMADAAGKYSCDLHIYVLDPMDDQVTIVEKTVKLSVEVIADAIVPKVALYEAVKDINDLSEMDEVVFFNGYTQQVSAPFNATYTTSLPGIYAQYANFYHTQVYVPEKAQSFKLIKNSDKWIFNAGSYNLGSTDKTLTQGVGSIDWTISFDNYTAIIKPEGSEYVIQFNSDRFKLYDADTQTPISLLKRIGELKPIESKLEVGTINFYDVERDEEDYVTVSFLTENIDDVLWDITGADKDLFSLDDSKADQGTLRINYLGTATKTGGVDAQLYALYENVSLDMVEKSFDITINLIEPSVKLTKLEFAAATPTTIDQGQSIDLAPYVVMTPSNPDDPTLSWATDNDYQGTITDAGVLTAKHVTGTVTVTVTSVRVPSVSATHTLTITEPVVTDFTLSDDELTMNIGDKQTISVTARVPEYALNAATFSSKNTDIATVHGTKGEITAKAIGDATIVAKIGDVEKECIVHVVPVEVNGIAFNVTEVTLVLGATLQLNPIIDPLEAADQWSLTWVSDNTGIAEVSDAGLVTTVAVGDAEISVTIDDKSAAVVVHVVAPKMFDKVTDPATLADKDTIVLATVVGETNIIAGPRNTDKKGISVIKEGVTITDDAVSEPQDALRLILGKETGGFTLTPLGSEKAIAIGQNSNDIVNATATNNYLWEFVADGENGVYVHNTGHNKETSGYGHLRYSTSNDIIKAYKTSSGATQYVYVYVRKYIDPSTNVEGVESTVSAQKLLRDGQIVIIRNGVLYSIDGKRL